MLWRQRSENIRVRCPYGMKTRKRNFGKYPFWRAFSKIFVYYDIFAVFMRRRPSMHKKSAFSYGALMLRATVQSEHWRFWKLWGRFNTYNKIDNAVCDTVSTSISTIYWLASLRLLAQYRIAEGLRRCFLIGGFSSENYVRLWPFWCGLVVAAATCGLEFCSSASLDWWVNTAFIRLTLPPPHSVFHVCTAVWLNTAKKTFKTLANLLT